MKPSMISFKFLFKHLVVRFVLCFILAFLTFALFDYSLMLFKNPNFNLVKHYLAMLLYRFEIFAIISSVFATALTLFSLSRNKEIFALQVAGLPLQKILLPFLYLGFGMAIVGYGVNEFGVPNTYKWMKKKHFRFAKSNKMPFVHEYLQDGSHIAYQIREGTIHDFFWIRPDIDVWHAKNVHLENDQLRAQFVDKFEKTSEGSLQKTSSHQEYFFPNLLASLEESVSLEPVMKIIQSLDLLFNSSQLDSKDRAPILTLLCYKLINPWYPLLISLMTFLIYFYFDCTRKPIWLCFLCALLFLCFFSLSKTFIILGENYVLSPWIPFIILPVSAFLFFGWRVTKIA